jgi:hypothetical protein
MKIYSDAEPPKSGKGRKIYRALKQRALEVTDLHYNANCWGANRADGWGTWACTVDGEILGLRVCGSFFCGIASDGGAYLEQTHAPYNVVRI